jgi:NADPH2:quinone reductase
MIPDDLDYGRAVGILVTYGTALLAIEDQGEAGWERMTVMLGSAGGSATPPANSGGR